MFKLCLRLSSSAERRIFYIKLICVLVKHAGYRDTALDTFAADRCFFISSGCPQK